MKKKQFNQEAAAMFDMALDIVDNLEAYPQEFIALPIGSPMAASILSKEKQRLLQDLKAHGGHASLADLAACVNRDPTRVSRDLKPLIDVGLVVAIQHGKQKRVEATGRPLVMQ